MKEHAAIGAVLGAIVLASCSTSDAIETDVPRTEPRPEPTPGPGTAYLDAPYATLSEYHFDRDGMLVPYDVHNELFADYAAKTRGLYLPPGTHATWAGEDEPIDMPTGAILVKRFSYEARWIETRLLVRDREGWRGHAYVWDEEQRDATLRPGGQIVEADVVRPDGRSARVTHLVPSEQQCKKCHADDDAIVPIGLRPSQFDRGDQIARFAARGILVGAPPHASKPRAAWDDPATGDVALRARAYLDGNCGYCHNPRGAARTSGLDLRASETNRVALGVCKPPVAAGRGSGDLRFNVVPGKPDESILVHRMRATEPQVMMPEIGRSLAHDEAIAVVSAWITSLPGTCP